MNNLSPVVCMQCGKSLSGRTDKKFCDAYCRNTFNNQHKSGDEQMMQLTNSVLRKNRRILRTLCPEGKATVRKEVLVALSFDFGCFTGLFKTNATTYYMVYDYAFAAVWERDIPKVLIVQKQPYMQQGVDLWKNE